MEILNKHIKHRTGLKGLILTPEHLNSLKTVYELMQILNNINDRANANDYPLYRATRTAVNIILPLITSGLQEQYEGAAMRLARNAYMRLPYQGSELYCKGAGYYYVNNLVAGKELYMYNDMYEIRGLQQHIGVLLDDGTTYLYLKPGESLTVDLAKTIIGLLKDNQYYLVIYTSSIYKSKPITILKKYIDQVTVVETPKDTLRNYYIDYGLIHLLEQ